MCRISVIAFLLLPLFSSAQTKYNVKRAIMPAALSFSAGAGHGLNQVLYHKNANFFKVFPNASRKFWGPESWKNKYNNFDPENGRNKVPIWLTDGRHLTASYTQITLFGAGLTIGLGERRKWWHYALDAGISFVSYSAGNWLVYDVLFR